MADQNAPIILKTADELKAEREAAEVLRQQRQRVLQLWFNGILTFATVVTLGVVMYQNRILNESVKESRAQSGAAQAQAEESRRQSEILHRQLTQAAEDAKATQIEAQEQTRILQHQLTQASRDAQASREGFSAGLEISRQQMQTLQRNVELAELQLNTNRPWLRADLKFAAENGSGFITQDRQITGLLVKPPEYAGYFHLTLKNVGRSVANNVVIYTDLQYQQSTVTRISELSCDDTMPHTGRITLESGEARVSAQVYDLKEPVDLTGGLTPTVFGCIKYTSDILRMDYETRFVYQLMYLSGSTSKPFTLAVWRQNPTIKAQMFGGGWHR